MKARSRTRKAKGTSPRSRTRASSRTSSRTRARKPVSGYSDEEYPSLQEHRASRRRFLLGSLAVAGAGVLSKACPGWPRQMMGAVAPPDYHQVRFPAEPADRAVYLQDGGYARFYAVGLTYDEDVMLFAEDHRVALTDALAAELSTATFDDLSTASGVSAMEVRMRTLLIDAYNDNTGDTGNNWFQELQLTLVRLDAPEALDGMAPAAPSYP